MQPSSSGNLNVSNFNARLEVGCIVHAGAVAASPFFKYLRIFVVEYCVTHAATIAQSTSNCSHDNEVGMDLSSSVERCMTDTVGDPCTASAFQLSLEEIVASRTVTLVIYSGGIKVECGLTGVLFKLRTISQIHQSKV